MKKFKNFGYKQETIEVREISMGNLVHIICQALISNNKRDMEIRIVDCYAGEVDVYNGMEDLLMQDFIMDWKVNAYKIECLHNNKTDKDFLKVIIADNNGSGYEQSAFYQLMFRQCAYVLKFGSLNSQTKVGKGLVSASAKVNTGGANAYGMDSEIIKASNPSYMTDGKHQVKCLGVEDFWGNIYEWIDGIATDSSNPINILTNTDNFQDNGKGDGYISTPSGMSGGNGGWLKEPQGNTEAGFAFKAGGGSSTTYFSDYAYLHGGFVAYFGGVWYDGDNAGAFRLRVSYSASDSYGSVSARLMYL